MPYRNYLIILFRDQPFELWDLKSFTIIRRLPKKCPKILALVCFISAYIFSIRFFRIKRTGRQILLIQEKHLAKLIHQLLQKHRQVLTLNMIKIEANLSNKRKTILIFFCLS